MNELIESDPVESPESCKNLQLNCKDVIKHRQMPLQIIDILHFSLMIDGI